ncbi:TIR-like protein FxsC [Streptomyces sp. NPDC006208]|uniref:TIR-like protein FxsC n=1 Tax=Streptomyces sp. NPDC006208 TaxID=3156734 RepID=UPI0033A48CB2
MSWALVEAVADVCFPDEAGPAAAERLARPKQLWELSQRAPTPVSPSGTADELLKVSRQALEAFEELARVRRNFEASEHGRQQALQIATVLFGMLGQAQAKVLELTRRLEALEASSAAAAPGELVGLRQAVQRAKSQELELQGQLARAERDRQTAQAVADHAARRIEQLETELRHLKAGGTSPRQAPEAGAVDPLAPVLADPTLEDAALDAVDETLEKVRTVLDREHDSVQEAAEEMGLTLARPDVGVAPTGVKVVPGQVVAQGVGPQVAQPADSTSLSGTQGAEELFRTTANNTAAQETAQDDSFAEDRPSAAGLAGGAHPPRQTGPDPDREELFRGGSRSRAVAYRPYFYLSYAHTPSYGPSGPDPDMWVERLFRDLCGHVMAMTDLPAGASAGFMDRELRSGEGWSEQLSEALATSQVFVPLISPRYFASEMCGKEWYAFAQRSVYHHARSDRPAEAVVPAMWVPTPPDQLPEVARHMAFDHRTALGDRSATGGFYELIKLRIFAEEYEAAVYELAKRIVGVAEATRIAPGEPIDHRTAPSSFRQPGLPPRDVRLTVAAPTRNHLPDGRSPDYYGGQPKDWNPFHPGFVRPLASVAHDLVRSLNYRATVSSFVPATPSSVPPPQPEILLVDRWALEDDDVRRRLAAYDATPRSWVTVIVPWNRNDPQSRTSEAELADRFERTMPRYMRQGRAVCRAAARGVPGMKAFGQILPQVLESAVREYDRHFQPPPSDSA